MLDSILKYLYISSPKTF
jgi:hypothetical protein